MDTPTKKEIADATEEFLKRKKLKRVKKLPARPEKVVPSVNFRNAPGGKPTPYPD